MEANYDKSGCGGKRFSEGKTEWHLWPMDTVEPAVRVMMMGKKKYGEGNWEKGMAYSTIYNCLMRHIQAWYQGEDTDKESGESHLAHAMCNVMMLTWYQKHYKGHDDRPLTKECMTATEAMMKQAAITGYGCSKTTYIGEVPPSIKATMTEAERNEKYGPGV